jgi:hypothetical protein
MKCENATMSEIRDLLIEMFHDPQVLRANQQRIGWELSRYVTKLRGIDASLWTRIEPALECLEDSWARDVGITREAVIEAATYRTDGKDPIDPLALLATSTIFGYGTESYGPDRLRWMLDTNDVASTCNEIFTAAQAGPKDGFACLYEGKKTRIKHLAASMGSKYLYFASHGVSGASRSLINDERVFEAMELLEIPERANPAEAFTVQYVEAVKWMHDMAAEINSFDSTLEVGGEDVEYALFQYSAWKRRRDRLQALGASGIGRTCTEQT